jgi:peptidoglycan-N-acetylmuramic acid deacetylase
VAFAAEEYNWYIKKNGNSTPTFPKVAEKIDEYSAFYIGKCEGEKKLYLTFDAGYENGNVEKILDTLKKENVPGAFFLLDNVIIKNTDLVLRMASEGHLVCNHTKNHKNLSSASEEEIKRDITALEKIYRERCGLEMSKYFRFPEGKFSIEALKTVNSLGYKTVFWSFAYCDWDNAKQPSREWAIKNVINNTHPGAVILLHPTSSTNAEILPELISIWRSMGYSFGTLDELTK